MIIINRLILTNGKRTIKSLGLKRDHFDKKSKALSNLEELLVSIETKGFKPLDKGKHYHSDGVYLYRGHIDSNMAIYQPDGNFYYSECDEAIVAYLKDKRTSKIADHIFPNPNWLPINPIYPIELVNILRDASNFSVSYPQFIYKEHRKRPYIEFYYENSSKQFISFLITASNSDQSCFDRQYGIGLNVMWQLDDLRIDIGASDDINIKEMIIK